MVELPRLPQPDELPGGVVELIGRLLRVGPIGHDLYTVPHLALQERVCLVDLSCGERNRLDWRAVASAIAWHGREDGRMGLDWQGLFP